MHFTKRIILSLVAVILAIGTGLVFFSAIELSLPWVSMFQFRIPENRKRGAHSSQHGDNPALGNEKNSVSQSIKPFAERSTNSAVEQDGEAFRTDVRNYSEQILKKTGIASRHHQLPPSLQDLTVVYYMVPKCGSRTLFYLMGQLKEMNRNLQEVSALTSAENVKRVERTKQVQMFVAQAKKPAFLYIDTHFVPIQPPDNVMYISIVRDPLERFLSHFSFHNSGDNLTAPQNDRDWGKNKVSALDHCVRQENPACTGKWLGRTMHSRFCGTGVICYQTCRKNFQQGTRNLLQKYHVVGMLEEFEDFLLVLEKLVPWIFEGISELYRHPSSKEFLAKVKTSKKVQPSEETRSKLRGFLERDYKFYGAVKNKFYALKEKLGLQAGMTNESAKQTI